MDYRDWGRGDLTQRERQPLDAWDDVEPRPGDPEAHVGEGYPTPSRRRARHRGGPEPVDHYTPTWARESSASLESSGALESGAERELVEESGQRGRVFPRRGGGRHRHEAPDDQSGTFHQPDDYAGWQTTGTTSSWPRITETTDWRRARVDGVGRHADDTGEWSRSDSPMEGDEDGYVGRRRDTAGTGRRPAEASEPGHGSGGVDWAGGAATGWAGATRAGQWDGLTDTGQWDRPAVDRARDKFVDTGQWDRFTDTGQWDRGELSELGGRDDVHRGGSPADRDDGFWSGTRLAGDDPRWMDTPASAPRSPAVAYPSPPGSPPPYPPRQRVEPTTARRRTSPRIEDDLLEVDCGGLLASVIYTAVWYAVPLLVVFGWMLTLDSSIPAGCVTDVTGGGCESARTLALNGLLSGGPRFGAALVTSMLVAIPLRWASRTWKAASVGVAAAIVGGGLATLVISAINDQRIG